MKRSIPNHLNAGLFRNFAPLPFILVAVMLSAPLAFSAESAAVKPPKHILLIYADDLGFGDIGCYGGTQISTPNLDRLARQGLRFQDAHSSASTCTPSRYSLLTGKYAFREKGTNILPGDANLIIPEAAVNLPSLMKKAGYATGVIGKWHLGLGHSKIDWNEEVKPGPIEVGFDYEFILPATLDRVPCVYLEKSKVRNLDPKDPIEVSYQHPVGNDPTGLSNPELLKFGADKQHSCTIINGVSRIGYMKGGQAARWNDEAMPELLSDKAVEFMEKNKDHSFFLYYAMVEPHVPRIPNPRFVGATKLGPRGDVIVQLDWEVGKLLAALDRLGIAEETLVIFSSDNGPVLNDGYQDEAVKLLGSHRPAGPFSGGKYSAYEGGTRIPLIVRWPKDVKPGVSSALVCQVDFLATLAKLTGQEAPRTGVDSQDLLPALLGKSAVGRDSLVEQGTSALGLRAGNWKYIKVLKKSASFEKSKAAPVSNGSLYNLAEDPDEKHNLAETNPGKAAEMANLLEQIRGPKPAEIGNGGKNDEE